MNVFVGNRYFRSPPDSAEFTSGSHENKVSLLPAIALGDDTPLLTEFNLMHARYHIISVSTGLVVVCFPPIPPSALVNGTDILFWFLCLTGHCMKGRRVCQSRRGCSGRSCCRRRYVMARYEFVVVRTRTTSVGICSFSFPRCLPTLPRN